jgi:mevalonate kinase
MGKGRAPGKVILVGEHFVVHGAPALALPLPGRGIEVTVERGPGAWAVPSVADAYVRRLLCALNEAPGELQLALTTDLPIGAGLGGSAALAVALVRALDDDGALDTDDVRQRAHQLEKLAHGDPSGIDDSVAAYGCPVRYQRGSVPEVLQGITAPRLWVGLTAERTSTIEAVDHVSALASSRPRWFRAQLSAATALAESALEALLASNWSSLGGALSANHQLLQSLEVSTPALDRLVDCALDAGAYGAKLTGGGLGGAAIAIAPPELDLTKVWLSAGATEVIAP